MKHQQHPPGRRAAAVSAACLLALAAGGALAPPASAGDRVADKRSQVKTAQARVEALAARMQTRLADLQVYGDLTAQSLAEIGVSRLKVAKLEGRAAAVRRRLNARAREAYKRGPGVTAQLLFAAQSPARLFIFERFMGSQFDRDQEAYLQMMATRDALLAARGDMEAQKDALAETQGRLARLVAEASADLQSEQALLAGAKEELERMEAERRRAASRVVSPAVEARRAARQIVLDGKLGALLDWIGPTSGPESHVPPNLRPTGIVTTGLTSWYGPGFDRRRASSGATYKQEQMTAASLVLPFGTILKVSFRGRSAVVVITDRGPYVPGRVLDLSAGAAQALGLSGVKEVRMEILTPARPSPAFP